METQTKLDFSEAFKDTPRPSWNLKMQKELVNKTATIIQEWSRTSTSQISFDDCAQMIEQVLKYDTLDDGFELAKEFEEYGLAPDSELVSILDSVYLIKHQIKKDWIKKWVTTAKLELKLNIGTSATIKIPPHGIQKVDIVELYPDTLQYGVWAPILGYQKGKGHRIINAEKIETK